MDRAVVTDSRAAAEIFPLEGITVVYGKNKDAILRASLSEEGYGRLCENLNKKFFGGLSSFVILSPFERSACMNLILPVL